MGGEKLICIPNGKVDIKDVPMYAWTKGRVPFSVGPGQVKLRVTTH